LLVGVCGEDQEQFLPSLAGYSRLHFGWSKWSRCMPPILRFKPDWVQ
jgi:hypothetical protein